MYLERKTYAPWVTAPSVQINTGALPLGAQESWRKVLTQSKNKAERERAREGEAMHEITSTDEKWAQAGVPAGGRA